LDKSSVTDLAASLGSLRTHTDTFLPADLYRALVSTKRMAVVRRRLQLAKSLRDFRMLGTAKFLFSTALMSNHLVEPYKGTSYGLA
jgi:hypothetical protein